MEIYHPKDEELIIEMKRARRVARRKRVFWGVLAFLVLSSVFGFFVFNRYFTLAVQHGPAMGETLPDGTLVVVSRNNGETYQRGDIVLYESEGGYQIKRITAVGGDNIVISPYAGIRINGETSPETWATGKHAEADITSRRLTVGEQELFLQGDQRSLSVDSRYADFETVEVSEIAGKVEYVVWPVYRFGPVEKDSGKQGGGL